MCFGALHTLIFCFNNFLQSYPCVTASNRSTLCKGRLIALIARKFSLSTFKLIYNIISSTLWLPYFCFGFSSSSDEGLPNARSVLTQRRPLILQKFIMLVHSCLDASVIKSMSYFHLDFLHRLALSWKRQMIQCCHWLRNQRLHGTTCGSGKEGNCN